MTRLRLPLLTLLATLLIPVSLAHANAYTKVLAVYQRTGSVPTCSFSSTELENALKGVDTYGAQYFADFTNAIQAALDQRASGACLPGTRALFGSRPSSRNPKAVVPAALTPGTGADVPAPILLLGIFVLLLALGAGAFAVAHLRGWDPGWAVAARHAWAEAGYRMGGTWAEFRDWLRSA